MHRNYVPLQMTRWIRPIAYASGNAIEPAYVIASLDARRLVRIPEEQLRREVRRRLFRYLKYCLTYSKYWRERWPRGLWEFAEQEAEDVLAELPCLSKEDLLQHREQLHISPAQRPRWDGYPSTNGQFVTHSGGSTGVPTEVWQDRHFVTHNRAVIDLSYSTVGALPGHRLYYLWGSNNELQDIQASRRKRLSTWARGLIRMPAFALDEQKVRAYVALINDTPDVDGALCFVSALDTFLRIVEQIGCPLRRIARVVTGGGKLHEDLRARVLRLWADDVFELYGSRDAGIIGMETADHKGIRVFPWHTYVEVLNGGRRAEDGGVGDVHVTCLENHAFALLRMNMGDVAIHRRSQIETNWPCIGNILGRAAEHLLAPNGGRVDPSAVIHLIGVLESRTWLRKFQLIQNDFLEVTLRLETWTQPASEELEDYRNRIGAALGRMLGGDVNVSIETVDHIAPTSSGKHMYCIGLKRPNV